MSEPIRVAIVEDDEHIRNMLVELIGGAAGLRLAGAYADGSSAVAGIPLLRPNVVLMDIQLPGQDGIECVRELKAALPDVCFLMLTVYENSDRLFESLKAGASGYLLKRAPAARLLEAIREVHAGGSPMTPQIARRVVDFFSHPPSDCNPELGQLSPAQKEFLSQLARGYSYKEIADHLGITMNGVRSYVRRVYDKLHVHSRTEAVVKFMRR